MLYSEGFANALPWIHRMLADSGMCEECQLRGREWINAQISFLAEVEQARGLMAAERYRQAFEDGLGEPEPGLLQRIGRRLGGR